MINSIIGGAIGGVISGLVIMALLKKFGFRSEPYPNYIAHYWMKKLLYIRTEEIYQGVRTRKYKRGIKKEPYCIKIKKIKKK